MTRDDHIDRQRGWLSARARALHRDEGGAVALLCLAACLILLMVTLITYDTGQMTRDKLDVQMAADTAAYSQASVKARSMNMIAFANVGKRTITGVRDMYRGNHKVYNDYKKKQCGKCGKFNFIACTRCIYAKGVLAIEKPDNVSFMLGRLIGDGLTDRLDELDDFQEDLSTYTPYWAYAEGVVRGSRNGGHFVGTYPLPDNSEYGALPVDKDSGFLAPLQGCLSPSGFNPTTAATALEWKANHDVYKDDSMDGFLWMKGPADVNKKSAAIQACAKSVLSADAGPQTPWHFNDDGSDGEVHMRSANFVFTYRHDPDFSQRLRRNYDFIEREYSTDHMMQPPQGGVWSMARGEVYYPEDALPTTVTSGAHGYKMFAPNWIGKLRPVALPGEDIPVDPSEMWEDNRLNLNKQASLFLMGSGDAGLIGQDTAYMEQVMKGLDGKIDGKEVMDGISK